jgi:hypothetical protein
MAEEPDTPEEADKEEQLPEDPTKRFYLHYVDPGTKQKTQTQFPLKNIRFVARELTRVITANPSFAQTVVKLVSYTRGMVVNGESSLVESTIKEGPAGEVAAYLTAHSLDMADAMSAVHNFIASLAESSDLKVISVVAVFDDPDSGPTPKALLIPYNNSNTEDMNCFWNAANVHLERFELKCKEAGINVRKQPGDGLILPGDALHNMPDAPAES